MDFILFVFDSTTAAIAAQKLLSDLDVIVMPTLREISAACGISLRLSPDRLNEAVDRLSALPRWRLYAVRRENKQHICTLIKDNSA